MGIKRTFDIAASLLALILLSPLFALLALIIKLTSRGPVFYRQQRVVSRLVAEFIAFVQGETPLGSREKAK